MPRPNPATPRVAHHPEAMPRDLFVPAMNERVGMNDRGRPSGSPLHWDTWGFWPDRRGEACSGEAWPRPYDVSGLAADRESPLGGEQGVLQ